VALAAAAAGVGLGAYAGLGGGGGARASCPRHEYARYGRPRLDRRPGPSTAPFLRGFDRAAVYYGAAPDEIRAIDRPCFESPAAAQALLPPDDLVVGFARGHQAHAYPLRLLSYHEVVNDRVGDVPVAITWCPLCSTALAFDRRVRGRELHFGVSGLLYRANQILFDRETGSLWSQLLGGAISGRLGGDRLRSVPLVQETWRAWRTQHPNTVVLSIRHDAYAKRFTEPIELSTGRGVVETDDPYDLYESKIGVYFPFSVRGIVDGTIVLGLRIGERAKAYPWLALVRRRAIGDLVGGEPVLVTYDGSALSASAFSRRLDGRVLRFRLAGRDLVDGDTKTRWSLATGRALSGPLAGKRLRRLPATQAYWFAWREIYPMTAIY
jgi:hypothetical protein